MLECKEELVSLCMSLRASRLDFLACNTLPGWKPFYTSLEESGLVVGASSDQTGNLKYGGNWLMENTKEDIQGIYFTKAIEYYKYLLDIQYDITVTTSSVTDMTVLDAQINSYASGTSIIPAESDDVFAAIDLTGNPFVYNGTPYSTLYPSSNGGLFFNIDPGTGGGKGLTNLNIIPRDALFPMLHNFYIHNGYYVKTNIVDNKLYIVYKLSARWNYTDYCLFSVTLYLQGDTVNSGKIVVEYGNIVESGNWAAVGQPVLGFALTGEYGEPITYNSGFFTDSSKSSSKFYKPLMNTAEQVSLIKGKIVTIFPSPTIKYDITVTTSSVTDMTVLDSQINNYADLNVSVVGGNDDGYGTISLGSNPFIYNGTTYSTVYPSTNGALFFNENPDDLANGKRMFSLNTITRDAVFPMFGDLSTAPGGIRYKIINNILSVVYNPTFLDNAVASNKALFSVSLYLTNHPDSGKIVFEYGTITPSAIMTNGDYGRVNMGFALTPEYLNNIVFNDGFFTNSTNNSSKFHKVFIDTAEKTELVQRKIVTIRPAGSVTIPVITFEKPTLSSYQTVLMGSVTGGGVVDYTINTADSEYLSISGSTLTVLKPLVGPVMITASSAGATSVSVTLNPSDLSGVTNIPRTLIANFPSTLSIIQTPLPVLFTGEGNPVLSSSASNVIALEKVGDSYFVVVKSNPTTSITVSLSIGQNGYYAATNTVSKTYSASDVTFDTNICFPERTPILTDQGLVPIEELKNETIHGSRIVHVTKTVHTDSFLVCFEKDALGENLPSMRTVMSSNHGVEKDGVLVEAIHFVNDASVHKIQYNKEPLYNVLLENHSVMNVNGLICETLNPSTEIARFYMNS
jgi:hypothetical protein